MFAPRLESSERRLIWSSATEPTIGVYGKSADFSPYSIGKPAIRLPSGCSKYGSQFRGDTNQHFDYAEGIAEEI